MRILRYGYLGVSSESLDPDTITARLGIEPDRVEVRGSRSVDPLRPVAHRWRLDASPGGTVDAHLEELLGRIEPVADRLVALTAGGEATATIVVVRSFDHPDGVEEEVDEVGPLQKAAGQHQLLGFGLEPRMLGRLAELGIGLDVDEYG